MAGGSTSCSEMNVGEIVLFLSFFFVAIGREKEKKRKEQNDILVTLFWLGEGYYKRSTLPLDSHSQ